MFLLFLCPREVRLNLINNLATTAAVSPQIPKTGIEPLPLRLKLPSRFAAESHWASDHHPNCLRNETIMTTTKKVETDDKKL